LISVITATIPGREHMLEELEASVRAQARAPEFEHLVMEDTQLEGCSVMVNRLVEQARGEWLFLIADDDLLLPGCLATHWGASENADIVYAPPLVWGIHDPWWYFQAPPAIPATALMRRDLFLELGGYDESAVREEDRKLWTRAMQAGARFVRASSQPTWVYRMHSANKSLAGSRGLVVAA
jgi:hypothetical protein